MSSIEKKYLVTKRNVLNEIRSNNMTLQELRFFSIYLSKINPKDIETRIVKFSLDDFRTIMELGRININYLKDVTNSLLCKVVNVPLESGGYTGFQLFKKCVVDFDKQKNEWYIAIDANDDALSLMFEFKQRYFKYELWNALRLGSSNQLRMYEILKQYEYVGERILQVDELKALLGISKKDYERYSNFKTRVLDACQKALKETTDICFTYEPHGKKGVGGKINQIKFIISRNEDYIDQMTLDEFVEYKKLDEQEESKTEKVNERYMQIIYLFSDACENEFTDKEIIVLYDIMFKRHPIGRKIDELRWFHYLKLKYDEMKMRAERTKISNRFGYLKTLLEKDEGDIQ